MSDYARFDILYHEGGVYFDTDVEVIKSFDDILVNGAFMGCEIDGSIVPDTKGSLACSENTERINPGLGIAAAPGLGIAAAPGLRLYEEILKFYDTQSFINEDGTENTETVVTKVTKILVEHGLKDVKEIQRIDGVTIYPKEYFNPLNNNTGKLDKTENTHSIHWYSMTWLPLRQRIRSKITRPLHRIFGEDCFHKRF